ncbi:MAG: hypothetical protein IKR68_05315 [Lachnospiraceae bacterium]|nr:hypothetical protein [Lachnospiraceae bacterium]
MKLVYLGTDAHYSCFEYLVREHEVVALYSCGCIEDYFRDEGICELARQNNIRIHKETITGAAIEKYMDEGCFWFFSADYGRKIPVPADDRFRGVNMHASLLPEGRCYCPIECAMERGLSETGVTLHRLEESFDTGDILFQERVPVLPGDSSVDLYMKCDLAALGITKEFAKDPETAWQGAKPQRERLPMWRVERYDEARLSHELTVDEASCRYRIYNRMMRVKCAGSVWFIVSAEFGNAKPEYDEVMIGDRLIYRLADGHVRLALVEAHKPEEVWESIAYPFAF